MPAAVSRLRSAMFRVRGSYHLARAIASGEAWSTAAAPVQIGVAEAQLEPPAPPPGAEAGRVLGVVEEFSHGRVVGWVNVRAEAGPVTVTLHAGKLEVARTTAVPPLGGYRRNGFAQIRRFRFKLDELWDFLTPSDRLTVRVDGKLLPISGRGAFRLPGRAGTRTLEDLEARLTSGYLFGQKGALQLPKSEDVDWQRAVLGLYARVREILADKHGVDVFFAYGTLLGAVRENGFIGHDLDFDAGFVSSAQSGPAAASELHDLGETLADSGLAVRSYTTHLHLTDAEGTRIDLFHFFWTPAGTLASPFGVAGEPLTRESWQGTREVELGPGRGLVPADAETFVAHLYGPQWRTPDPGWAWNQDRAEQAVDGALTAEQTEDIYWASFYARAVRAGASSFCAAMSERPDLPLTVLDLGCGDGRDSFAFADSGRTVVAADRSHVAVRRANEKADGRADLRFLACDVSDADQVHEVLGTAIAAAGDAPLLFYARFFLHSIPAEAQAVLLTAIAERARPGDMFAAEFRTDGDEANTKVYDGHYRRFQNAAEFSVRLRDEYGFTVLDEVEGTGLAPYKDEDPVVYRVVARR